jgi:hypothetical protein
MDRAYAILLGFVVALALAPAPAASADAAQATLEQQVGKLDHDFFDSFNRCHLPGQLEAHAAMIDPKLEFYHDLGGVTWTRDAYIAGVKANVCGKFAREMVPGSMKVSPIKDYGAFSTGTHRFCHFDSGRCEGEADFAIIWHVDEHQRWTVTRVVSYAHREAAGRPLPLPTTPMLVLPPAAKP